MTLIASDLTAIEQRLKRELPPSQAGQITPLARRCRWLAITIGMTTTLIGGTVLAAWAMPAAQLMSINVAFGVLLCGLTLSLQCLPAIASRPLRQLARLPAGLAAVLGLAAIAHGLGGSRHWLDPMLGLLGQLWTGSGVSDMHPMCAFSLALCGIALLLQDIRTRAGHAPTEYLALSLMALNLVPLTGHAYGVTTLTLLGSMQPVPWLAAMALMALGAGLLLSQPSRRLMAIITDEVPGGQMLRKSLPQTLLVLVVLNWIVNRGALLGAYDHAMVSPLLTLLNSSVILVIFWRTAFIVNNEYRARLQSAGELAVATALLIAISDNTDDMLFVKNCEGQLLFANPAMLRRLGKSRDEALYRTSRELLLDPEEAQRIDHDDLQIMQTGISTVREQTLHLPEGVCTFSSTRTPWYDSEGKLRGLIGISTDISVRKEMERQLKRREGELEATISQRTAALRKLADHMESVREEEKRAIARELHDDMGAALTSLNMHLDSIYKMLPTDPDWTDRINRVKALVASLVATTRRIQIGLRPIMLDLFGLKAGISEQLDDFEQRTGIAVRISLPDEEVTLPHKLEITLYRMLQEALNNVAKHARASQVEVILDVDEDRAALTVRDNGIGIPQERIDNQSTYGIRGLSERASFLGGTAKVFANKTKGTTVVIELPATL